MRNIDDFDLKDNNSKIYFNGSIWGSKNYGKFKIVGKTLKKNYYLCEFESGTIFEARSSCIRTGEIKNKNYPTIFNKGFIGQGKYKIGTNNLHTRMYILWYSMLERCYNPKFSNYCYYGGVGIGVAQRWYNFQLFCEDIEKIDGYSEWTDKDNKRCLDKDIICERENIYPKIYSKDTCMFVTCSENVKNRTYKNIDGVGANRRMSFTAISPTGEIFEREGIIKFSKEHNLDPTAVSRCLRGEREHHKNWRFKNILTTD